VPAEVAAKFFGLPQHEQEHYAQEEAIRSAAPAFYHPQQSASQANNARPQSKFGNETLTLSYQEIKKLAQQKQ
jgi:hypothetical protein